MKDPFSHHWSTQWYPSSKSVELNDFKDWLPEFGEKFEPRRSNQHIKYGYGRNVEVFDKTRQFAYRNWHDGDGEERIIFYANGINSCCNPQLPQHEVATIVKSIFKYMRTKWHGEGRQIDRGVFSKLEVDGIESGADTTGAPVLNSSTQVFNKNTMGGF